MDNAFPEIPHLNVLRRIGSGATAQVYEAAHTTSGEKIAVKVVSLRSLEDDSARARVRREVNALQTLKHPGIVQLLRFYEDQENLTLELEYVDGCTLAEWLEHSASPLYEPKLWILAHLAQAIGVAHMSGTLHRDLKPENILISREGEVKLTDFGLSKQTQLESHATQPGLLIGSLAYMAPEFMNEGKSSFASDVFSFGVIAFELLTGRHPFPHDDVKSLLGSLDAGAPNPSCSPPLPLRIEDLLLKCLNPLPTERPASIWEAYSELMACLHESGIQDLCKTLVGASGLESEALAQALAHKQGALKKRIETELLRKNADRKALMRSINEFAALFPNDQQTQKYVALLRQEKPESLFKKGALLFLFILLLSAYPLSQYSLREVPPSQPQSIAPTLPAPNPLADAVELTPQPKTILAPKPAPPKPTPLSSGTLDLQVPTDVRVFIDGKRYGSSDLRALKLSEGAHQILLERDGYQAIEQTIRIKKGGVTRIHTRESSPGESSP